MRGLHVVFWIVALAGAAVAAPDPAPPPDFTASQYIDGHGCVFLRQGQGWAARLDDDNAPLCGFPPSLSVRGAGAQGDFMPVPAVPPPNPAELLAEALAAGLRQGEFGADPLPPEIRRDDPLPERPSALAAHLLQQVRAQASLRAALTGAGSSNSDLCARLGYVPDDDPAPVLGGDVTQGLCPGMRAPTPEERILPGQRAPVQGASQASPIATPAPVRVTQPAVRPVRQPLATQPPKSSSVQARRQAPPRPISVPEMIPASARYVQVGTYLQDDAALVTIRRLAELGYRTAQTYTRADGKVFRVILAGPFTDRQTLVTTLNRLRAQGYPHAIAR